jgi:hypothetical protein
MALQIPDLEGTAAVAAFGSIVDGRFLVANVVPGQYVLRARYSPIGEAPGTSLGNDELSGAVPVTVGTDDVEGIAIRVTRGTSISGRVVVAGSARPDPAHTSVSVESGEVGRRLSSPLGPDGTFALRGIESGPRRLDVSLPGGWFVKAVQVGTVDVTDVGIDVRENDELEGALILVTDRPSRLEVIVAAMPDGTLPADVAVFPVDQAHRYRRSRRIQIRAVGGDPGVTFENLPEGEYFVAAADGWPLDVADPRLAFTLDALQADAVRVRIDDGRTTSVTIGPRR